MEITMADLMNEIKKMQIEIGLIRKNLVDSEYILTESEEKKLNDALVELEKGETYSLEDIEKERRTNA